MALLPFQLWGRTVPCPISILETFKRNDHCMWQKSLVKNSCDLSLKQNNNFWHSSSFSPYQQRSHHYISLLCPQSCLWNQFKRCLLLHIQSRIRPFWIFEFLGHRGKTFIISSSADRQMCLKSTYWKSLVICILTWSSYHCKVVKIDAPWYVSDTDYIVPLLKQ